VKGEAEQITSNRVHCRRQDHGGESSRPVMSRSPDRCSSLERGSPKTEPRSCGIQPAHESLLNRRLRVLSPAVRTFEPTSSAITEQIIAPKSLESEHESRESTIVPEWPPGYLDAFEPPPWPLAASEWGVERSPWKYHMSPAYLSYGTNAHARTGAFEAGRDRSMAAFRILPLWAVSFPGSARKFPVCVFYGNLGAGI
jgi:hypothetical protein